MEHPSIQSFVANQGAFGGGEYEEDKSPTMKSTVTIHKQQNDLW
jgi:hypothetical protein